MANEVTPHFAPQFAITGVADEALTGGTLVGIAGDEVDGKPLVGYAAADGGKVLFVAARDAADAADIALLGPGAVVTVTASGAISAGGTVMSTDAGAAKAATATTGLYAAGFALADAADNLVKIVVWPHAIDSDDS